VPTPLGRFTPSPGWVAPTTTGSLALVPGMGGHVSADNPYVVAAFHAALRQQAVIALLLVVVALLARARAVSARAGAPTPEHPARRLVRIGFGALWLLDGLLQTQQAMPVGLPSQVVHPAAAGAPAWVQQVVSFGLALWVRHPVTAASSVVWIQVGVGLLLLLAPPFSLSRLAGAVSAGWGVVVWVFGEAFGSSLSPGQSWLFGFPGSALVYVVAGIALALPERSWSRPELGRDALRWFGGFLLAMALLEAWPGRGFWHGGTTGSLTSMLRSMARTPQPSVLSSLLAGVARASAVHGGTINLVVVVVLLLLGTGLLAGRGRLLDLAVLATGTVAILTWVVFEDLGVLGGVGTDPNSMIPEVLLLGAAWLVARRPDAVTGGMDPATGATPAGSSGRRVPRIGLAAGVTTLGALGVVLVGLVPMAASSFTPGTTALYSEALNGAPQAFDAPAPGFELTDQAGRTVSLADLRGRAVALTFLDPVCTNECPLIAQDFREVDAALPAAERARTAFVAVVANPLYRSLAVVDAFDRQEGLAGIANWYYLTGPLPRLRAVWSAYGVEVQTIGAGSMVAHSSTAVVIDPAGRIRTVVGADPGNGGAPAASLRTVLASALRAVLPR